MVGQFHQGTTTIAQNKISQIEGQQEEAERSLLLPDPMAPTPPRGQQQQIPRGHHHPQPRLPPLGRGGTGRPGAAVISIPSPRARRGGEKPRQEICAPLKWGCFLINFLIFLASVACLALGIYLCLKDPRPVNEIADVLLNPAFLFTILGLASGVVSLFGLFGALRDNIFLLKMFALFVFLGYVTLVVFTFSVFVLFYSDSIDGFSVQSILHYSIKKYHTNRNIADIIDYLQEQLECCGSGSLGFRDWQLSQQFNCTPANPYPERCGVPYSCCRRAVVSEAGGNTNPLAPAIRSLQCWQNAQRKPEQELDNDIYTSGCLQPLRALFDRHAIHMGMAVVAIIIPVSLGVCLSQCLARQIDYQHYLLRREQRRFERRERRERRYVEQKSSSSAAAQQHRRRSSVALFEGAETLPVAHQISLPTDPKRPPPNIPPPPTPKGGGESMEDAVALATAIAASKREFEREKRRRQRRDQSASNNSPGTSSGAITSPNRCNTQEQSKGQHSQSSPKGSSPKASSSSNVTKKPNVSSAGKEVKTPKNAKIKSTTKEQQQKAQKSSSGGKDQQGGKSPPMSAAHQPPVPQSPRAIPSAPPVHYILQQSHFS